MKKILICSFSLLLGLCTWQACENASSQDAPAGTWLVVSPEGTTLFGQPVAMENLQAALLDTLSKMEAMPDSIAIHFDEKVLMGARGDIQTEVNAAIAASKTARLQQPMPDTVFVDVDSLGTISFGGKDLEGLEDLEGVLTDSLASLKKHHGSLPELAYRTHGDVLMGMRGALRDVFAQVKEKLQ